MFYESHLHGISITAFTFFLKLILEQLHFVAIIFSSLELSLFILWEWRILIFGKCLLISSSMPWDRFGVYEISIVCFVLLSLQLLLKVQMLLNCIVYTTQGSGFINHLTLGKIILKYFSGFSMGFLVQGEKSLNFSILSSNVQGT